MHKSDRSCISLNDRKTHYATKKVKFLQGYSSDNIVSQILSLMHTPSLVYINLRMLIKASFVKDLLAKSLLKMNRFTLLLSFLLIQLVLESEAGVHSRLARSPLHIVNVVKTINRLLSVTLLKV
jgi:hypothetical protein